MSDTDHPILCEHLAPMLAYLIGQGKKITFAGQAWSSNCRMWVYLDCQLPMQELQKLFPLPSTVHIYSHRGTHDGSETGFVCDKHHDAIMGAYIEPRS